ncbi:nucleolar protein 8 [Allomyces arbusculus]|nr:nucleolar protein 8 [Allomyces arbusculus]
MHSRKRHEPQGADAPRKRPRPDHFSGPPPRKGGQFSGPPLSGNQFLGPSRPFGQFLGPPRPGNHFSDPSRQDHFSGPPHPGHHDLHAPSKPFAPRNDSRGPKPAGPPKPATGGGKAAPPKNAPSTTDKPAESLDDKTPTPRRIYLGGLTDPVTPTEVESRFRAFGTVSAIAIPQSPTGAPRGFLHFTLTCTGAQLAKLMTVYNGTKWKGGTLAVSRANRDPVIARNEEREALATRAKPNTNRVFSLEPPKPVAAAAALPRGVVPGVVSVRASKPVSDADDSADLGRLWKRSRMGRAVALMRRMHRPGVGRVTIDPSVYRACLEPLYVNPRPTRVADLTWSLEGWEGYGRGKEEGGDWWEEKGGEEEVEEVEEGEGESSSSEEDEIDEEEEDERAAGSDAAASAPSSSDTDNSVSSEDDGAEDEDAMDVDDNEESAPSAPSRAQQLDIFSDEEADGDDEEDNRFAVKDQFEGESGRELLALQAKARGDDRFKLTADFAADGSDADSDASSTGHAMDTAAPTVQTHDADEEGDEAIGNLAKERDMAMSLLSSMFGEDAVQESVKKRAHANVATNAPAAGAAKDNALARTYQLTGMAFYDPDAPDHEAYELQPEPEKEEVVEVTADPFLSDAASESELSASEDESDEEDDAEPANAAAEKDDGKEKDRFGNTVRADFSAIFTRGGPSAEAQSFSLFNSAAPASTDAKPSFSLFGDAAAPAPTPVVTSASVFPGAALASTQFFISARLAALEAGTGKHFVRTADVAEIEATWRATRRDLAVETHRRAKNAARKAMRRKHGGAGGGQTSRA